jgi:L-aminopeptidase/D-esterase-like protein
LDGDLVFALSLGRKRADLNSLGTAAAAATAEAVVRAVEAAQGLGGVPSCRELRGWENEVGSKQKAVGRRNQAWGLEARAWTLGTKSS